VSDALLIGLLYSGSALGILSLISFVLTAFIALRSPPGRRAAWTAGLAYALTTVTLLFGGMPGDKAWLPLAGVPGALLVFWFWRRAFRKAWIDDRASGGPGVRIEDDDWRHGLAHMVSWIGMTMVFLLIRRCLRG
jgi:hypothetical protein